MRLVSYEYEKINRIVNVYILKGPLITSQGVFGKEKKSKHKFNYKVMKQLNDNKQMKDVWKFTSAKKNEKSFGKHPTQKPIQLLDLIIKASTDENDTVLDPFNGSGTTGVSCVKNKRKYVGIELEKKFCDLSKERFINEFKELKSKLL